MILRASLVFKDRGSSNQKWMALVAVMSLGLYKRKKERYFDLDFYYVVNMHYCYAFENRPKHDK